MFIEKAWKNEYNFYINDCEHCYIVSCMKIVCCMSVLKIVDKTLGVR